MTLMHVFSFVCLRAATNLALSLCLNNFLGFILQITSTELSGFLSIKITHLLNILHGAT